MFSVSETKMMVLYDPNILPFLHNTGLSRTNRRAIAIAPHRSQTFRINGKIFLLWLFCVAVVAEATKSFEKGINVLKQVRPSSSGSTVTADSPAPPVLCKSVLSPPRPTPLSPCSSVEKFQTEGKSPTPNDSNDKV